MKIPNTEDIIYDGLIMNCKISVKTSKYVLSDIIDFET